jgi:hypothetical protein
MRYVVHSKFAKDFDELAGKFQRWSFIHKSVRIILRLFFASFLSGPPPVPSRRLLVAFSDSSLEQNGTSVHCLLDYCKPYLDSDFILRSPIGATGRLGDSATTH